MVGRFRSALQPPYALMQNHVPGKAVGTVSVTKDNYDSTKVASYTWNGKTYDVTAKEVGDDFKVDDGASCNDAAAAYHAAYQEYAPKAQEATSRWSDYQNDVFEDIVLVMYGVEAWVLSKAAFVMRAICVLGAVPYGTEAVLALLERHPGRWPTSLSDRNDVPSGLSVAPLVIAFALFVMAAVFLPHDDPSAIVREFARLPAKLSPT